MRNYSANYDTPEEMKAMAESWNKSRSSTLTATQANTAPSPASPTEIPPKADGLDKVRSEWSRNREASQKPKPTTDPIQGAMRVLTSGSHIPITIPPNFTRIHLFPLGKTLITRGAVKQLGASVIHRCFQRHASGDWGAVHPARASLNASTTIGIHLSRYHVDGRLAVLLTVEKLGSTILVIQAAQP
jgi:hypothetical protein